jgi:6-phosphogluconolactonase
MIRVLPDLDALSQAAAEIFVRQAQNCLAKGRFSVALSGGETPRKTYELLSRSPLMDQVPWHIVHFFWGDERWVPLSDPRSNERMARETLLNNVPVPEDQIHSIYQPHINIQDAAWNYGGLLREFFANERQLFDLVFLGLGENGHTASLFPHTSVLVERDRWVGQIYLPDQDCFRITLTPVAINRSAQVVFMVSGDSKADILHDVLEGPLQPGKLPAQMIEPAMGEILWLVDKSAAQKLTGSSKRQNLLIRR